MEFKKEFFEDEVIDDFLVPTMIKRGWAASLEVLEEVDCICKRHDIKYMADWGTLLGTVRHHGFIPWDDDIDLCMKRSDYQKFMEVAELELPPGYTVHHAMKQDKHCAAIAGIYNYDKYCIASSFMEKNHNCPAAVGLDIFVYDYLPRDPELREQQAEALDFLVSLIAQYEELSEVEKEHQLKLVKTSLGVEIEKDDPSESATFQLGKLLEQVCMLYTEEESDDLCNMMVWQHSKAYHFPKEWVDDVIYGDFMGFKIPMIKEYDKYLRIAFGEYMQEIRNDSSHEYPYFEKYYSYGISALGYDYYEPQSMKLPRKANNKDGHEKVLFLPCQAKHWDELSDIYKRESAREDADVYIVAVPYFRKNYKGEKIDICYEGEEFPYELPVIHYDYFDIDAEHPDKIYFQVPWDQYHEIIEVPDYFFTTHLRNCCEQLIYVPFNKVRHIDESDERTAKMLHYSCRYPGIIEADKVEVPKEMQDDYLKAVTTFAGEETKAIWMYKLGMRDTY